MFRRADDSFQITPYQRRNRHDVRDLLFRSLHSHTHLDWHETDQWLDNGRSPVVLAWQGRQLVGVMGASEPMAGECWIRVVGAVDGVDPLPIISALWSILRLDLKALHVERAAVLFMREWMQPVFQALGFAEYEWIVTLRREAAEPPPDMRPANLIIRPTDPTDFDSVLDVDHAAFAALWRMTANDIRQAMRMAASCTLALIDGLPVGYQLSTMYFDGSHLARLAVIPTLQANGIGAALVGDVLRRFARRGIGTMSVNTQLSNERSQRLYRRLRFQPTGYDLAVWTRDL